MSEEPKRGRGRPRATEKVGIQINIRGVSPDIYRLFKSACVARGVTMGQALTEAMAAWTAAQREDA